MALSYHFVYIVFGFAADLSTFINTSPWLFIALNLCWCHALFGVAALLTAFVRTSRHAVNIANLVVAIMPVVSLIANILVQTEWNGWVYLFIPLTYCRAAGLIILWGGTSEVYWLLPYLLIGGSVAIAVAVSMEVGS